MCGCYYIEDEPAMREIVQAMNRSPLLERMAQAGPVRRQGEIRPGTVVPVIATGRAGGRAVFPMKWGFSGKRLLINARTETAAARPSFRDAWREHRCVVPASCYVEWKKEPPEEGRKPRGIPYRVRPRLERLTWLCGLYRLEEGRPCFVILTREPAEDIRFLHDRMPLMLPESRLNEWILPSAKPEPLLEAAVTELDCRRL